mmetsp:Transcript_13369/g.33932  ORF Transcript_13369/g.33932 Transcript_13369/m.33932 type:complete len:528 (-) Transcript_13369:2295-3878(-)
MFFVLNAAFSSPGTTQPRKTKIARHEMEQISCALRLSSHFVASGLRVLRLALKENFTRGRRIPVVCAACLYIVCRLENTAHMLLDFADALSVNLYAIGAVFLKLTRAVHIAVKVIDPSLYIHRFAAKLAFKGKTRQVALSALRLVARMKRDWMCTGRRPTGICGAALLVAARMHGFVRDREWVVRVVRAAGTTICERLVELNETHTARLTAEEVDLGGGDDGQEKSLVNTAGAAPRDPPAFIRGVAKEKERLAKEMERLASEEAERAMRAELESEEVRGLDADEAAAQGGGGGKSSSALEVLAQFEAASKDPGAAGAGVGPQDDPEDSADIDDAEVMGYINTEAESKVKELWWVELNKDYIKEQEDLEKLRVENPEEFKRRRPYLVKGRKTRVKKPKGRTATEDAAAAAAAAPKESEKINYAALLMDHSDSDSGASGDDTTNLDYMLSNAQKTRTGKAAADAAAMPPPAKKRAVVVAKGVGKVVSSEMVDTAAMMTPGGTKRKAAGAGDESPEPTREQFFTSQVTQE